MAEDPLVVFATSSVPVERKSIRAFAERLRTEVTKGRPYCAVLTSDAKLQKLNREFLQKDYPTDVLSFPSGSAAGTLGDIAISLQRAAAQAAAFQHAVESEVAILLLHGVLHLMGHDHEGDRGRMRRLENRWRKSLDLPHGLIERSHQGQRPQ